MSSDFLFRSSPPISRRRSESPFSGGGKSDKTDLVDRNELRQRSERVKSAIDRARAVGEGDPAREVTLIAVSKTQPVEAIAALYELGHREFGENYVQELVSKAEELERRGLTGIRWHFIGHLQSNKAKALVPWVAAVHTLDSEGTAKELAKRWLAAGPERGLLPVFLEVNIDGEDSKGGVLPDQAPGLAMALGQIGGLELRGLMCIPSPKSNGGGPARAFARLRALEADCQPATRGDLSMGMSGDFETAISEGATHVRVGTSIFGERPAQEK
jgi:pyridoxal phosphate enzyme (YggS family)